jgi:sulfur transfer complex TusBCD TusB component (DsrH family)
MKLIFTLLLSVIYINNVVSQNYTKIDKLSKSVPTSLKTFQNISQYLTKDLTSDKEKIRAIYIWIAHNINYNLNLIKQQKRYNSTDEIISEALKTRSGVCQHYSELFNAMCQSIGIESYVVVGYTINNERIDNLSHAWNAVLLDSVFYEIDVTWASGFYDKDKYIHKFRDEFFLIEPQKFIKTHIPFDPIWQFLNNPISHFDIENKDYSKLKTDANYLFQDSINLYLKQSKIDALKNSNRRISNFGITNELIKRQLKENLFQIVNIEYNVAIDTLNFGVNNFNSYISIKNKGFKNSDVDLFQIKELLLNANNAINEATKILSKLQTDNSDLKKMIFEAKNKMPNMLKNLERENKFIDENIQQK